MSQADSFCPPSEIGRWWAAVPRERWPENHNFNRVWHDDFGDRRQEIVFIGLTAEMNKEHL